jgi:hypothetical protein
MRSAGPFEGGPGEVEGLGALVAEADGGFGAAAADVEVDDDAFAEGGVDDVFADAEVGDGALGLGLVALAGLDGGIDLAVGEFVGERAAPPA